MQETSFTALDVTITFRIAVPSTAKFPDNIGAALHGSAVRMVNEVVKNSPRWGATEPTVKVCGDRVAEMVKP